MRTDAIKAQRDQKGCSKDFQSPDCRERSAYPILGERGCSANSVFWWARNISFERIDTRQGSHQESREYAGVQPNLVSSARTFSSDHGLSDLSITQLGDQYEEGERHR